MYPKDADAGRSLPCQGVLGGEQPPQYLPAVLYPLQKVFIYSLQSKNLPSL